jgi:hypothetical protein
LCGKTSQLRKQHKEIRDGEIAAHCCEYAFPGEELGLWLEQGDGGLNAVVSNWTNDSVPKYCWNLQPGDVVSANH